MPFNAQALRDAATGAGDAPPDAHYDAELVESKVITANTDGRLWLLLSWRVLAGAQRDEQWESWHSIDMYDKQGQPNGALRVSLETIEALGVDLATLTDDELDLHNKLRAKWGQAYDVEVKRNPPFTNTYVKGVAYNAAPSLPGTADAGASSYGKQPTNAIYGGDAPAPQQQTTLVEQAAKAAQPQRTGESDVTPANAGDDFKHPPVGDDDDVPWETHKEPPPKRGDVNPDTGEEFPF